MNGKPSIMVAWVSSGVIRAEFVRSLLSLQGYEHKYWSWGGIMDTISPYIDENRNMLVKEFLESTVANWLLMVDIDMYFKSEVLDVMYEHVSAGEKIIMGIYNQFMFDRGVVPLSFMCNDKQLYDSIKMDKPQHIDAGPAGFLLMHREPLEALRVVYKNDWFTRMESPSSGRYYGEDMSFCRRLKAQGIPILGVPNLPIKHLKIVPI